MNPITTPETNPHGGANPSNPDPTAAIGWTTTDSRERAEAIARELLRTRLVACAQISTAVTSLYEWDGRLHADAEFQITLKFLDTDAAKIEAWLAQHHDYEVPQWLWIRVDGVADPYWRWMCEQSMG